MLFLGRIRVQLKFGRDDPLNGGRMLFERSAPLSGACFARLREAETGGSHSTELHRVVCTTLGVGNGEG